MPLLSRKSSSDGSAPTAPPAPAAASSAAQPAVPTAPGGSPVRQRRRPALVALGVALVMVCSLGAYWLVDRLSTTTEVVVVAADVPEGQLLTADDLAVTDVTVPTGTAVVPGDELDSLVGQRAEAPLQAGALLTPGNVSEAAFPAAGTSVVGVKLQPGQMPVGDVDPGDTVHVIGTPREGDDPPTGDAPLVIGTVQAIGEPTADGAVVVDVIVPSERAATLASLAATGRVALILAPGDA